MNVGVEYKIVIDLKYYENFVMGVSNLSVFECEFGENWSVNKLDMFKWWR